ncbi:MAG: dTDP-4-dehydrorhamnose 3,5-epimerase [Phycisphaerae bacterium]|nr:dTDP-4-dehydrorhamnose 3,5-epimerase [Phycisphaerae bacterium]
MQIIKTSIPGILVFEPKVFRDTRGFFVETWNARRYRDAGITEEFVQDNISCSCKGTLRGLHFQHPGGQGKLAQVLAGRVFDVAVDIRVSSPSFGRWFGLELSSERCNQIYIPPGFAHGFCVLSDTALFSYKCTAYYDPRTEGGIRWDDPEIGIEWPPDTAPILSAKDARYGPLSQIARERLPEAGRTVGQ